MKTKKNSLEDVCTINNQISFYIGGGGSGGGEARNHNQGEERNKAEQELGSKVNKDKEKHQL